MDLPLHSFKNPTEIIYGFESVKELKPIIDKNGFSKILIITDPGIVKAGLLEDIQRQLNDRDVAVFSEVEPNPSAKTCDKACQKLKEMGAEAIVAVGGGSAIDTAKAVGILATNGGSIPQYEGVDTFENPILPLIAIPTTAGTGSETTISTVITDTDRQYKLTITSKKLAPAWAIVDPLMTVTLPPHITASTGLDALVHGIESYTSKMANPLTRALSREAMRLIAANLRKAVFNGDDLQARDAMMMGSLLAGMAFSNARLGNCHAMSHPVSAMFGVAHGVANSILIPHVMEFNLMAVPELFGDIAEDMGERVDGLITMEKAYRAVEAVKRLSNDIGIPESFSQFNVDRSRIPDMAKDAMLSRNIMMNPRKTTYEDVVKLYERCV